MGEYGIRKSDGESIKIGTCNNMYYLRLEDKNKVTPEQGSHFGEIWRLPLPKEDGILPGSYDSHIASYDLIDFNAESIQESDTGIIQLSHESGLLINVTCYHGLRLPEESKDFKSFWNGKRRYFTLAGIIKDHSSDSVSFLVKCKYCRSAWECSLEEIEEGIVDDNGEYGKELLKRLRKYAEVTL